MKADLSIPRWVMSILGQNPITGKLGKRVQLAMLIIIITIINSTYTLVTNWGDEDIRPLGIQSVLYIATSSTYVWMQTINYKNANIIIETYEKGLHKISGKITEKRVHFLKTFNEGMLKLNGLWFYASSCHMLEGIIVPPLLFIVKLFKTSFNEIKPDSLYLKFAWTYLPGKVSILDFVTAYIMQSIVYVYGVSYGYICISSTLLAMKVIGQDLKSLRLYIKEMGELVCTAKSFKSDTNNMEVSTKNAFSSEEMNQMKTFILCVVEHHAAIYRKVADITNGMKILMLAVCSLNALFLCSTLFKFVETKDVTKKILDGCFFFLLAYRCVVYDYLGEIISTEDENVRWAVYDIEWTNTPNWFKKSLHIILTRCNKEIIINPAGVFEMNLKNSALMFNAMYTYYNLLNNFKE